MSSRALLEAPGLAEIEALAREAFDALPAEFRALCGKVSIAVADFATEEVLDEMEIEDPFDLMGLFQGVGMAASLDAVTGQEPNRIWLYRRPMLDYWCEHEETLGAVVSHVLIHEIGHHVGFSDEDMDALEAAADAGDEAGPGRDGGNGA